MELSGDNIEVTSKTDKVVQVSASGSSIAENRIKLTNLPNEDLIVLLTGTGSRKLAANYDLLPQNSFSDRVWLQCRFGDFSRIPAEAHHIFLP